MTFDDKIYTLRQEVTAAFGLSPIPVSVDNNGTIILNTSAVKSLKPHVVIECHPYHIIFRDDKAKMVYIITSKEDIFYFKEFMDQYSYYCPKKDDIIPYKHAVLLDKMDVYAGVTYLLLRLQVDFPGINLRDISNSKEYTTIKDYINKTGIDANIVITEIMN